VQTKRLLWIVALGLGLALTLALLVALGFSPEVVRAASNDWFVEAGGTGDCTQANPCALQTAPGQAVGGDTIYVAQGTYTGSGAAVVTITQSITLYGGWDGAASGPPVRDPDAYRSVLDGEGARRVIYISGAITPTIDGFTITGGNASNAPAGAGRGGGIYSLGATPLIANNVITHNIACTSTSSSGRGGGIYVENAPGAAVITGNQVLSNVASISDRGYGGGIYLAYAPAPLAQVVNNVVLSNTASVTGGLGFGGGIALYGSSGTTVIGNRVEGNVAQGGPAASFGSDGGGIYCHASNDVTLSNNVVRYNTASVPANGGGGGIGINWCQRLTVVGNTLQGNVASASTTGGTGRGGGLYAYASRDLVVNANRVLSNTAHLGGGLYLLRNTTFTMTNNIVAGNRASYQGGGLAFETDVTQPVTGTLVHNTFAANDRGSGNGRIAIHLNDPYVTLVLTNNLIYSHTYGVYAMTTSTATLYTTLFYANSSGDTGGLGLIVNTDPITGQDPLLDADYHLGPGSAAIDVGVDAGVTADIDGDPRPIGPAPDVGADEARLRVFLPLVLR
jgi:hypothetical protein